MGAKMIKIGTFAALEKNGKMSFNYQQLKNRTTWWPLGGGLEGVKNLKWAVDEKKDQKTGAFKDFIIEIGYLINTLCLMGG